MASDWARLGEKLKSSRIARGMEQQQVAAAIGVKRGAVRNIEQGNIAKLTPTVRAYGALVGWTDGSVEAVLAGGDPTLAEGGAARTDGATSDLSLHVQESLRRGPLLESRVQEVTTPAGRVLATIVLRGDEGLTPEELLEALRSVKIEISTDQERDAQAD
ncbi:helix-turn-helix domain-containing protein [Streptomyces griseorubiginosus]|uniref:helix-turn-helix domain-containing protein n=1 Tax=Streptomyces griseorubiginosus TaxID=67304 RepID=UPI0036AC7DFC